MARSKQPLPPVLAIHPPSGDGPPRQLPLHVSILHSSNNATAVYSASGIVANWHWAAEILYVRGDRTALAIDSHRSSAAQRIAGEWNACQSAAREAA